MWWGGGGGGGGVDITFPGHLHFFSNNLRLVKPFGSCRLFEPFCFCRSILIWRAIWEKRR